jgi:chemotaxis protein histidine kinase CheA
MKPDLFPNLPADLSAATDDELTKLHADHLAAIEKIKANDTEFLGELSAADIVGQLTSGRDQVKQIEAAFAERKEAQETYAAKIAELTADIEPLAAAEEAAEVEAAEETKTEVEEVEVPQAEAETAEVEAAAVEQPVEESAAVEELEAVAAAAQPVKLARPPKASRQHTPQPAIPVGVALVASSGIEGIEPGARLDRMSVAKALISVRERSSVSMAGISENVVVASAKEQFPEERILEPNQGWENTEKIKAVVGEEALTASGGLCAPRTPLYDLPNISVADRPVRAALPSFMAVRGGIQFAAPPTIADITTAVGIITEAQDAAGGSSGTKTCQTIICPDFSTVDVNAIFACISAGNLGARAYPEQVAQFVDLVGAAHARTAETKLLDLISAGSVQVTTAAIGGATASLFPAMLAAASGIRSHFRMSTDAVLRLMIPSYAKDLLKADIVRQPFDKFQLSDAEMLSIIRSFNLEPSFYMDGETGGGQVFGAQSAGALLGFPSTVKWFIWPEGTWLHLDGGSLNLGLVRDSTLNSTNTYQLFNEDWESVAKVGVVSYEVTSTVADTGELSAPVTITNPAY